MNARRILARILYLLADGIDLLAEALCAFQGDWEWLPTQSPAPTPERSLTVEQGSTHSLSEGVIPPSLSEHYSRDVLGRINRPSRGKS